MRFEIRTIDAHVAGAPVRLLVSGVPPPSGSTPDKRRLWLQNHADHLRRAVVLEPRGHRDLVAALLTEPVSPGADAGLLFMDAAGYPALSGAAVIAGVTIALERGLITKAASSSSVSGGAGVRLSFDTPAGQLTTNAHVEQRGGESRVALVRTTGVPSFVARAGCDVKLGARRVPIDLAFSGGFYAVTDSETVGVPLTLDRVADLRRVASELCAALINHEALVHPAHPVPSRLEGVVFTGPPQAVEKHLRCVTVTAHGCCDRSPGLAGTSSVMAVLHAMGLLREGDEFVSEGLLGVEQRGSILRSVEVGELPGIVAEIEGTAWITSDHTLHVDDDNPLKDGYLL